MAEALAWYSLNEKTETEEHPPVPVSEALAIARKYYANGDRKFQSAEEAVKETMFGLMRDKDIFIEICVDGPASISYKFEMPKAPGAKKSWLGKIFVSVFQHEATLTTWDELEAKVVEFYTEEPEEIRRRLTFNA